MCGALSRKNLRNYADKNGFKKTSTHRSNSVVNHVFTGPLRKFFWNIE